MFVPRRAVGQVLGDEITEAQTFIQLPHQDQATVGGDPRSLEIAFREALKQS